MPSAVYPNLFRMTYSGQLPEGEIFQHGFWITSEAGAPEEYGALGAAWTGYVGDLLNFTVPGLGVALKTIFNVGTSWSQGTIRQYHPETGVPYDDVYPHPIVGVAGTSTASPMPTEVSHCITVSNGRMSGRRRFNRWYMPAYIGGACTDVGRVLPQLCAVYGAHMGNWLTAREADTVPSSLCYYSGTGHEITAIASFHVGDVYDVQRRRRNALNEVRTNTPVV